ncbi:MAG: hypothetical protein J5910_05725 [Lachnospiraceae bacterium]|nr:hypothetical protein [Lachnospiraceae bacterium]
MNVAAFGFAIGLMIAAVVIVILFKFANKDGKVRTEYDERQKGVRGKAYRYAFYTEVFAQAVLMFLYMGGVELPLENYVLQFIAVISGCTVLAVYCIWNDVYWGLNNDHRKYHIIFIVAILLNMLPVIGAIRGGNWGENGKLGLPFLNVVVLVLMAIVYAELFIKNIMDKKDRRSAGEEV